MKALTIMQPWAGALIEGWKPIENRTWKPPASMLGQRIAIHSSKSPGSRWQWRDSAEQVWHNMDPFVGLDFVERRTSLHGHLLGSMLLVGWVDSPKSPKLLDQRKCERWWVGPFGWVLAEPKKLAVPIPMKGNLGLWNLPDGLVV